MTPLFRFIAASGLANLGDGIALVAWGWIATQLTRDPLLIALVPVALKAPWFAFSLPAGIVVDRFDRKHLILMADVLRAVAYAAAGLVIWASLPLGDPPLRGTDRPGIFALIAICATCVGAAEVLRDNAAQTMMPALVPEQDLERANGRLWSFEFIMNDFVGTATAGLLLGVSLALPFGVNALALALAAALVAGLKNDPVPKQTAEASAPTTTWSAELREGIGYLLSQPILRGLAVLTGIFNFAFEAMMVTLVLIVQERLGLGPLAISAIMASGAIGGVSAGFINDRIVNRFGRSRVLRGTMLATLAMPLAVMMSGSGHAGLALICVGFFVSEFAGLLWNTVSVSYRQRHIPRRLLGRVNSAYRLFAIGMAPLGMLTAGLLTRFVGDIATRDLALVVPYALGLAVFIATILIYWRFLGRAFPVEPGGSPR